MTLRRILLIVLFFNLVSAVLPTADQEFLLIFNLEILTSFTISVLIAPIVGSFSKSNMIGSSLSFQSLLF